MENNFFSQIASAVVRFFGGNPKELTPAEMHEFVTSKIEDMDKEEITVEALNKDLDANKDLKSDSHQKNLDQERFVKELTELVTAISERLGDIELKYADLTAKLNKLAGETKDLASIMATSNVSTPIINASGDEEPMRSGKIGEPKIVRVPSSLSSLFGKTNN